MRDNGTPTTITTAAGTPVYIADKPCTCCGCFEAFVFECNCGAVHSDVCYHCGRFVDMQHKTIEDLNAEWAAEFQGQERADPSDVRCTAGQAEHRHETFP